MSNQKGDKSASPLVFLSLNRHGTFLHTRDAQVDDIVVRLANRIEEALQQQETPGSERAAILKDIQKAVSDDVYTSNVREERRRGFKLSSQETEWLAHQPEDRWVDYIIYRYQFNLYPRQQKQTDFPLYVLIEPTSVCNLRCVMCFQIDTSFTKKEFMGYMPWELFVSVADQIRQHKCRAVTLASRGEPTLHPRFGEMLNYLAAGGVMDLKINTNATRLTEQLSRDILEAGVNEVVFSVDAGTKETYEGIRILGRFEEVVAKIERFRDIREADFPNSPTITRISGVRVREDQNVDQMNEFWRERVDQVTIRRATPRWDSYNNPPSGVRHPCAMLWERLYVWYDGQVNPCDFDYKTYLCVGNAKEQTLQEIWQGDAFNRLRKEHLEKRRNAIVPCDRCPIY